MKQTISWAAAAAASHGKWNSDIVVTQRATIEECGIEAEWQNVTAGKTIQWQSWVWVCGGREEVMGSSGRRSPGGSQGASSMAVFCHPCCSGGSGKSTRHHGGSSSSAHYQSPSGKQLSSKNLLQLEHNNNYKSAPDSDSDNNLPAASYGSRWSQTIISGLFF